jgi:hypothetical protein
MNIRRGLQSNTGKEQVGKTLGKEKNKSTFQIVATIKTKYFKKNQTLARVLHVQKVT